MNPGTIDTISNVDTNYSTFHGVNVSLNLNDAVNVNVNVNDNVPVNVNDNVPVNVNDNVPVNINDKDPKNLSILSYNKTLLPNQQEIIYLTATKSSYIKIQGLPDDLKQYQYDHFNEMFESHPEKRHHIILKNKEVEVFRWQQSYLKTPGHYHPDVLKKKSYMFSGFDTKNINMNLPQHFLIYYNYVKSLDSRYNQVVANWYKDGDDYIQYHSDCEIEMIPGQEIMMLPLYGESNNKNFRVFSFLPKLGVNSIYDKINIHESPGLLITMCGKIQEEFRHSLEKTSNQVPPRISLTFRQY